MLNDAEIREIRALLAMCEQYGPPMTDMKVVYAASNPSTGYAATLRALLDAQEWIASARELLWEATENPNVADWSERVRAFLAEGESA